MDELEAEFESGTEHRLSVSVGSTGKLYAQIVNGAPFDVFLSADVDYPRQLVAAGLADANALRVYASGHLVIWARRDRGLDLSRGLASLTDARIRRIGVANPKYAPYGRAAVTALRNARLYDRLQPKLVMGESLAQTAQLVESGNADAGIFSLSLAMSPRLTTEGTYRELPRNGSIEDLKNLSKLRARHSRRSGLPARAGGQARASFTRDPRDGKADLKWSGGKAGT